MARKPSRMVLYEVASKAAKQKAAQTTYVKRKVKKTDRTGSDDSTRRYVTIGRPRAKRPLFAIIIGAVAVILAGLLIYKVVKIVTGPDKTETMQTAGSGQTVEKNVNNNGDGGEPVVNAGQGTQPTETIIEAVERNHEIVIATYVDTRQLEPVKEYFENNGIDAEIKRSGRFYILVTAQKYSSPGDQNGKAEMDAAKRKIKNIGDSYKPPKGFKGFSFENVWAKRAS